MSTTLHNRGWGWCGGFLVVAMLGACSDGYPTQDSALILQHGMSQERAMAAMNKLGQQQRSDYNWQYRLLPGCELEVHARKFWGGQPPQRAALHGADIQQTRDAGTGEYTIALAPRSDPTDATVVLERMDRLDATQLEWLLRHLPNTCAEGA